MGLKFAILKFATVFVHQPWARLSRGMTLGARVAVLDDRGQVMLVRHSYAPGWILPGGGVEKGETLAQAALREIREEAGIIGEAPVLHGIFSNDPVFKGDHVACFIVRKFSQADWKSNFEIAEAKFFSVANLPAETTGGTRRRLGEIIENKPLSEMW